MHSTNKKVALESQSASVFPVSKMSPATSQQEFHHRLKFQGEYFNDEEVRMMLAREVAEEKRRREEEELREEREAMEARAEDGKRRQRGIIIAS